MRPLGIRAPPVAPYTIVETDPFLRGLSVGPRQTLPTSCWIYCAACTCSYILLALPWTYYILLRVVTDASIKSFVMVQDELVQQFCHVGLTIENITYNTWWPGCGHDFPSQTCTEPCYDIGLLEDMDAFNKNNPGKRVTFQSRPGAGHDGSPIGVVELEGWWLPAPNEPAAPRIVLQHGFTENSNKAFQQLAAYTLRSIGFSVLVPNFRDHCYSSNTSEDVVQWSNAYPLDLLGAWDYAVSDPGGLLGGPREPGQVGLQGFSMGAFVTAIALGLEGRAPAAWVDSGPWTTEVAFAQNFRTTAEEVGLGFMSGLLLPRVWEGVSKAALERGVDYYWQLPQQTLPLGPDTRRPIYAHANVDDATVPFSEHVRLMDFLAQYPQKYAVGNWVSSGFCHGSAHHREILSKHEEYKDRLCTFWTEAFDLEPSYCSYGPALK
mmetsp:Transcript_27586/g.78713  ORF Transcript_27586/g.78713 Transcript_27586/m.78713 type:complete len:435 (+) Transcript_27586:68-1372(+)